MQGTRFHPLSGNSLHASGHLSLSTTATEAACSRAHAQQQEKPQQREAHAPHLERARAQVKAQHSQKNVLLCYDLIYICANKC